MAVQQIHINVDNRDAAMEFSKKSKWSVLFLLMLSCIACYAIGFKTGIIAAVIVGLILELCFWVGLFKIKPYQLK